ncbi:tRNA (N6-isopentenyl adenosine(37)-C2)-methylthiotransferase MiaB [Geofilum rhodophaeum]|uniref:tRNA (N6-isopentenyl adenosine(37)-C2)-methylthiotransferase MiaB n=1 Tax=Geofilum rhodophaeum TaxID=1965019 RepID=UPI000B51F714|nr:tRNA (N6-isopentenyl adenosine(37)-C2)-methylthiotransferase MiaB [Geofilum rhodophaeum]
MKYHLVVLGCQMNHADAERMQAIMAKLGYAETEREEDADVIGIIACSVRQKAIDKVYSKIAKWNKWKNKKNLLTFVSGCVLPDDREKFLKLFDLVFDMKELASFPAMLSQYGVTTPISNTALIHDEALQEAARPATVAEKLNFSSLKPAENKVKAAPQTWEVEPIYNSTFEAFIPIQNGCNKFCTFCAVPYTRGREVSRPSADILEEAGKLIERGYKSITLLGQNVNSYGLDKKGEELSFADLLDHLGAMADASGKEVWIYYTSPHPRDMTRDVIEAMARRRSLAKQVHLPVQSGDDKVLIRMNRKHSMERYREVVGWIRDLLPTATLFTDVIVGFTGETDEQFENTRAAVREFKYNMAYIAMYSPRPGAASFAWQDDVDHAVKKERYAVLTEDLEKEAVVHTRELEGKTVRMLVRGKDRKEGYLSGHTEGKIIVRFASEDDSLIGSFVDVQIESVRPFSAEGKLVNAAVTL